MAAAGEAEGEEVVECRRRSTNTSSCCDLIAVLTSSQFQVNGASSPLSLRLGLGEGGFAPCDESAVFASAVSSAFAFASTSAPVDSWGLMPPDIDVDVASPIGPPSSSSALLGLLLGLSAAPAREASSKVSDVAVVVVADGKDEDEGSDEDVC